MSEVEREVLEVDVLFVGAGPACLAGALHLSQLIQKHDAAVDAGTLQGDKLGDIEIAVIEKASEVGMHSLSGAVIDPRALHELMPDFEEQGFPFEFKIDEDSVYYLSSSGQWRFPITPPPMQNEGKYIASLHKVTRWMAEKVEAAGINVFCGFAGAEMLYDGDRVVGVRTGDRGVDKHGKPKGNFEAGIDIHAKVTVLGEGSRGSLTKQLIPRLRLDRDALPQLYATGVKEIWRLPEGSLTNGRVIHTMGFPAGDLYGGGFIYNMKDDLLALGFVIGLDYEHPDTDPHMLFQGWKKHPFIASLLKGGEMVTYGAKTITEGGYYAMPRLSAAGVLLVGESAGFLNTQRLKGIHLGMKSGMLAAETIQTALSAGNFDAETLSDYQKRFENSWARDELYSVRNFRQGFADGFWKGLFHTGMQMISGGRGLFDRRRVEPDHAHMHKRDDLQGVETPREVELDEKLTFKKLTDVYHSGTVHEEDQPCHLHVADFDICNNRCTQEYGNPCEHFCPARVYEMVEAAGGGKELVINFTNCVHCKTCDIMDPYQIITWVPPEGGGGPNYINM
jgi:electron-transferring-flavoprotein dehydrogenase